MRHSIQANNSRQGSAIIVVLMLATAIAVIGGSILKSSVHEKKMNLRNALHAEALRGAEVALELAFAEYVDDVETHSGLYAGAFSKPVQLIDLSSRAEEFIKRDNIKSIEIRSEFVPLPVRRFIDADDPANADDPLKNKFVIETNINLYAKVIAERGGEEVEVFLGKTMAIRDSPLFSHAIFFNDDLLFHRNFDIFGDVHSNGHTFASTHNGDADLDFKGLLTTVGDFTRKSVVDTSNMGNRLSNGDILINIEGEIDWANMNSNRQGNVYSNGTEIKNSWDYQMDDWYDFAQSTFDGMVMDASFGVPVFKPVGAEDARKDNIYTKNVNETNNSGYALIEPLLPDGHASQKNVDVRKGKMAGKAGLLLRVEQNTQWVPRDSKGRYTSRADKIVNDNEYFVVKGYKYGTRVEDGTPTLTEVPLPDRLIGTANTNINAVNSGQPYPEAFSEKDGNVTGGLEDTRTGRPMDLITLDVGRLKQVIEGSSLNLLDPTARDFRNNFNRDKDWNGVVYVEFPTSLDPDNNAAENTTGVNSRPFKYAEAETDIPELADQYRTSSWRHTPKDRTDNIVPIAEEFRTLDPSDTGMGLQVINGGTLPDYGDDSGFTLATNSSMYVVDHYNADGDFRTGTGLNSSNPGYAQADKNHDEVPAALMADSVTLLSGAWKDNRKYSNRGNGSDSGYRKANEPLEISASIASADYAVYEFFVRSLEKWQDLLNHKDVGGLGHKNPIVVKGSLVSFWDAEIPLIKDIYDRDKKRPVDKYWNAFASHAFTTPRFHQFLVDGRFPPFPPAARFYDLREFDVMYSSNDDDKTSLERVGFAL
ncbi:MAG: hypothetical protein ACQKBV_01675 [Puniceicoccales bacterium]